MNSNFIELFVDINGLRLPARDVLSGERNTILLGAAGSGKSTILRQITEGRDPSEACIISLRNIENFKTPIAQLISDVGYLGSPGTPSSVDVKIHTEGSDAKIDIYLDGVDEILPERRGEFLLALTRWIASLPSAKWIIASRPGTSSLPTEGFQIAYLLPLSDAQIGELAGNFQIPENLVEKLTEDHEFGTLTKIPLFAELMCSVFASYGDLPVKRTSVFGKYVRLLMSDWDRSRSVVRSDVSSDHLLSFLERLALKLLVDQTFEVSRDQLKTAGDIASFYKFDDLDLVLADPRITSFFAEVGHDRFGFVHRSIQEYLAASAIIRLPNMVEIISKLTAPIEVLEWILELSSEPKTLLLGLIQNGHVNIVMELLDHSPTSHGFLKNDLIRSLAEPFINEISKDAEPICQPSDQTKPDTIEQPVEEPSSEDTRWMKYKRILDETDVRKKGKAFEIYVREIFEQEFNIVDHNRLSPFGEFDLICETRELHHFWLRWKTDFYVECKNLSSHSPVSQLNEFQGKVTNAGAELAFMVSMSGFTKFAINSAKASWLHKDGPSIVCISGDDLLDWGQSQMTAGQFLQSMCRKTQLDI